MPPSFKLCWHIRMGLLCCFGVGVFSPMAYGESSHMSPHMIERAKQATVGILQVDSSQPEDPGYGIPIRIRGSGVHIGEGVLVTARHAVETSEGGKVVIPETIRILTDNLQELSANRLGANVYLDVAVYKLQGAESDWPSSKVKFAEEDTTYADQVFTVGFPMGRGPTLSYGRVGNPNTFLATIQSRLIQVDLSACRGNSGGGLFNEDGLLVGFIHAIIQTESLPAERGCSRFGFALPGLLVQRVVTAVLAGKRPGFSVLGIHLETRKEGNRWVLGVAKATGPSRHAGFRKGDILVSIDDQSIRTPAQLKNYLIERTNPGQTVSLHVLRGGTLHEITVKLGTL